MDRRVAMTDVNALRGLIRYHSDESGDGLIIKEAAAEIERLRQLRHEAECNLVAADANVERLRAALERIVTLSEQDDRWHGPALIARAALGQSQGSESADRNAETGSERRNPYEETADTLRDFLRREGYVRCDSQACNCGSYHGRFGLHERWQDMKDALAEAGHPLTNANGNTPLRALRELIAERDALRAAVPASASPGDCTCGHGEWLHDDDCPAVQPLAPRKFRIGDCVSTASGRKGVVAGPGDLDFGVLVEWRDGGITKIDGHELSLRDCEYGADRPPSTTADQPGERQ